MVISLLFLVGFCAVTGESRRLLAYGCDNGRYYDKVTGACSPCTDICQYAELQGTKARCKSLCPGFTAQSPVENVNVTTGKTPNVALVVGISLAATSVLVFISIFCYRLRNRQRNQTNTDVPRGDNIGPQDIELEQVSVQNNGRQENGHKDLACPGRSTEYDDDEEETLLKRAIPGHPGRSAKHDEDEQDTPLKRGISERDNNDPKTAKQPEQDPLGINVQYAMR